MDTDEIIAAARWARCDEDGADEATTPYYLGLNSGVEGFLIQMEMLDSADSGIDWARVQGELGYRW